MFFGKNSLQEIWNGSDMRKVRTKMLNGEKLPECQNCWDEEEHGKKSKRIRMNKKFFQTYKHRLKEAQKNKGYVSEYPAYLDLRLGNTCNLKCRTCNPGFSSSWSKELKKHETDLNQKNALQIYQNDFRVSKDMTTWYKTDTFFNTVKDIGKDLRLIYLSGGEPFLIKEHHVFLNYFLKMGGGENITIIINTNLTHLDQIFLEKLTHFKRVELDVSIDAYGKKNDWIRSPSQFTKIEQNLEAILQLPKNVKISINCTVSVYNVLYLSELIVWAHKIGKKLRKGGLPVYIDTLHQPEIQHISVLHPALKRFAIERLEQTIQQRDIAPIQRADIISVIKILQSSMVDTQEIQNLRAQLKEHTRVIDGWRNENFLSVFPEFIGYL